MTTEGYSYAPYFSAIPTRSNIDAQAATSIAFVSASALGGMVLAGSVAQAQMRDPAATVMPAPSAPSSAQNAGDGGPTGSPVPEGMAFQPLADYLSFCLAVFEGVPDLWSRASALGVFEATADASITVGKMTTRIFRSVGDYGSAQPWQTVMVTFMPFEDGKDWECHVGLPMAIEPADLETLEQVADLGGQITMRPTMGLNATTMSTVQKFEPTPVGRERQAHALELFPEKVGTGSPQKMRQIKKARCGRYPPSSADFTDGRSCHREPVLGRCVPPI